MKSLTSTLSLVLLAAVMAASSFAQTDPPGRLLTPIGMTHSDPSPNTVVHRCLTPKLDHQSALSSLGRMPVSPLASVADTVIRCLVLRVEFQPETPDDPNTTGNGLMDVRRPFDNPTDSAQYYNSVGHLIDPPPHDSLYFHAHMRALREYWYAVSKGKIDLVWDIYPVGKTAVFRLPQKMSFYGKCDFAEVINGLEAFARDAIATADSAHIKISGHPNINFANYQAIFLFHAGSDRQNDIGFPETCADLFTGFIRFGVPVRVDNGAYFIPTALMMPETANQDNRATALNAVMAHEFGHQLGLPDLYSTRGFLSQLGDFELMDNNGFGTGVDFGFRAGNSFGTVPVYPSAWCRAYLGLDPVIDVQAGTNLQLFAAATKSNVNRIYRVPISETEYYLIENRVTEIDNQQTFLLQDSASSVILGPVNSSRVFTGEYDFLIPGEGAAIYYVDESVASEDRDGDGFNNYQDNQLQVVDSDEPRRFLSLVEGDGLQNFGGFYRSGFGKATDLYRDDAGRSQNFTPNTNPPSRTQNSTQTGVRITAINRTFNDQDQLIDSVIRFDVSNEKRVGSPIRVGRPVFGFSPIATDLDANGTQEIITAAGNLLSAFTTDGRGFLDRTDSCTTCPSVFDSAGSDISGWSVFNDPRPFRVKLFGRFPSDMTANPVAGTIGTATVLTAVGYPVANPGVLNNGRVLLLSPADANNDGEADRVDSITVTGWPRALQINDALWIVTDAGNVYYKQTIGGSLVTAITGLDSVQGLVQLGRGIGVLTVANNTTSVRTLTPDNFGLSESYSLTGRYSFGPVAGDLNDDDLYELYVCSETGMAAVIELDTIGLPSSTNGFTTVDLGHPVTTNPILADVDNDNSIDVVLGGEGEIHAYDRRLITLENFPRLLNEKFRGQNLISSPIVAQMQRGNEVEIASIYQTGSGSQAGALYAMNDQPLSGFPFTVGRMISGSSGSPIFVNSSPTGRLGLHGADGWFYQVAVDSANAPQFWPMNGGNAGGSFNTNITANGSGTPRTLSQVSFYAYENPTVTGSTRLRFALPNGAAATSLNIYDLSGQEITSFTPTAGGDQTTEIVWDCSGVSPGVYRAVLEITLAGKSETVYTDIAVLR